VLGGRETLSVHEEAVQRARGWIRNDMTLARDEKDYRLVLTAPLRDLVVHCEIYCAAACCGLDAFEVSADAMGPWVKREGVVIAAEALRQLDALVSSMHELVATGYTRTVWSDDVEFDHVWLPRDCAAYLGTWRQALTAAMDAARGEQA